MTYRDLDIRLLEALREDARQSARQLSGRLGVSPGTVANRLRSLRERGILVGFRPRIDYEKLGFGLVAITKIKARGDALAAIVEALSRDARLTHVYEITGDFDVLVIGRFRDEKEMNIEIKRMLNLPGIEATNTSIVLSAARDGEDIRLTPDDAPEGRG